MLIDHLVHAAAWAALAALGPAPARTRLEQLTAWLPPLDLEKARRMHRGLRGGTCLSRAVAVASRVPGAHVVIGARSACGPSITAHAWVLAGDERIGDTLGMVEIARF